MQESAQQNKPLNVLIIGGGIAGLVLAYLLEQLGYCGEIVERVADWKSLGGGITLTLNGMKLLNKIGVGKEIEDKGLFIKHIKITNADNCLLSNFNVEQYAELVAKTITIHRTELHEILRNKLTKTQVRFNITFSSIEEAGEKTKVIFTDGRTGFYDLVVGCDGMYSSVRRALFKDVKLYNSGYSCWRFVCKAHDLPYPADTLTEMWGKGKRFGIVPLSDNRIHCFACINTGTCKKSEAISIPDFKLLFSEFGGHVPGILNNLSLKHKLIFNKLEDVYVRNWINRRVILIGDAAHGMTPNLTQGASMAIEDAVYLCNALSEKNNIDESLKLFFNLRKRRVLRIQRKSSVLGKIGQWESPILTGIRNYCWKNIPDRWIQKDFENLLIR